MGMFNDFLENAKVVVQKVGEKTSDAYDIARLKSVKCRISCDIEKSYKQLGRKYYILNKEDKLDKADFSDNISQIDDLHAHYENIVKQIEDLKNLKRCKVCGSQHNGEKPFCADCGAKL